MSWRLKQRTTESYVAELKPGFVSNIDLRYIGRKISAGVSLDYRSKHPWLQYAKSVDTGETYCATVYTADEFELGANIEWHINDRWGVYVECINLTGERVYEWLHYYTSSPQVLVGVKMNF